MKKRQKKKNVQKLIQNKNYKYTQKKKPTKKSREKEKSNQTTEKFLEI